MSMLKRAMTQFGVKEIRGESHNEIIVNYFKDIGHSWVDNDETAWCSAFINWCAFKEDLPLSKKLNARSWLEIGEDVTEPETGDIVVFWREDVNSWKGHVGIYINEEGDYINTLGGNQSNSVCVKKYLKERLLAYRRV